MKLCVTSDIINWRKNGDESPFRQAMSFLKKAGFDEIDFFFETPMMLRENWASSFREKLRQASDEGVRIRYAHIPFDYTRDDLDYDEQGFYLGCCRAMDLAMEAGADCAAIHPRTSMTTDYNEQAEHEKAVEFLAPFAAHAKDIGLVLALENMRTAGKNAPAQLRRYATTADQLIKMADELGIGICWDTGHANISGLNHFESLRAIGSRLKMVHINDNFADDDVHIAPFIGSTRWNEVAAGLKAVGYSGSMNLEVNCYRLPDETYFTYACYMAASAAKLVAMLG